MKKSILFGLIMLGCLSCKNKKDDCDAKSYDFAPDTPVDSTLLHNFLFDEGSYWVYNDEFNSKEDSVYVVSSGKNKVSNTSKSSGCSDIYSYSFNSAYVNLSGTTSPTYYTLAQNKLHLEGTIFNTVFLFDVANGEIKSDSIEHYPTILIDGINYADVYRIKLNSPMGYVSKNSYFYINDSIGIVRKDLFQPDSTYHRYYLKRYVIVK